QVRALGEVRFQRHRIIPRIERAGSRREGGHADARKIVRKMCTSACGRHILGHFPEWSFFGTHVSTSLPCHLQKPLLFKPDLLEAQGQLWRDQVSAVRVSL